APEKLLRALLLQVLYTVRSERLLMEQLDYNFLFRWFVGLSLDDLVWDATVFTKNRERLLEGAVAEGFFAAVVGQARAHGLLSDEHFTVDGTLIEAWAGHKSFKRKDNPGPQRRGQGGQAQLRRPRADGEPQRPRGQRLRDPGHRPRGTTGGHGDGGSDPRLASHHAGRGQGLRQQGICCGVARPSGHPARCLQSHYYH